MISALKGLIKPCSALTRSLFQLIDRSKLPKLDEKDLREQFVKGSGPGGQGVNKTVNCCVLKHLPTGIVVKCNEQRTLHQNRRIARELMIDRLDRHYNGHDSVHAQKNRMIQQRLALKKVNQERMRQLNLEFKASQLDQDKGSDNI